MIACLGRMHEFEAHFRGALRNGLTPQELAAILRQVAVYCGFPAAVDCHRVAKQVLAGEAKKT
jgi:4-carboxymuconolactone decarboxylase